MIDSFSFSDLIIWCCSQSEHSLRDSIKTELSRKGFSFIEDDYISYRNLSGVGNLLLTRGNPELCLVAHTDVCRDHYYYENRIFPRKPNPVIKISNGREIIQDKNCSVQVGGDDRLGVAIALWCALHTDHDLSILLTTDEEVGLVSASKVSFDQLNSYKLLIQIDRGNNSNQIVTEIRGVKLCDDDTILFLQEKMNSLGVKREFVVGKGTDVFEIKKANLCKNAINMTCGYHDSHGDSGNEYIDVQEAIEARNFVVGLF